MLAVFSSTKVFSNFNNWQQQKSKSSSYQCVGFLSISDAGRYDMPASYKKHWKPRRAAKPTEPAEEKSSSALDDEDAKQRNLLRSSTTVGVGVKKEQSKPNLRGIRSPTK